MNMGMRTRRPRTRGTVTARLACLVLLATGCAPGPAPYRIGAPYQINGVWYEPAESFDYAETGLASVIGSEAADRPTALGERFSAEALAAAHRTLQMPALIRVTNLDNGRSLVVRVNDRGPAAPDQILALTPRAAELLGFPETGTARVRARILREESLALAERAGRRGDRAAAEAGAATGAPGPSGPVPDAAPRISVEAAAVMPLAPAARQSAPDGAQDEAGPPPAGDEAARPSAADPGAADPGAADPGAADPATVSPAASEAGGSAVAETAGPLPPAPVAAATASALATRRQDDPETDRQHSHFVQAGLFASRENAERRRTELMSFGPVEFGPVRVNGSAMIRVRVGPFVTIAEARQAMARITEAGVATDAHLSTD